MTGWKQRKAVAKVILFAGLASGASHGAAADDSAVEHFYRGRTVTVLVGNSPGGGYDLVTRVLAQHMAAFIPGNPRLIVENMTGAASVRETTYLYASAPKDGSVFGVIARGTVVQPLFTPENFKGSEFAWLGSVYKTTSTCISWKTSPIKTWGDVMTREFVAAGQGPGADADMFSLALKTLFGARIRLVTGFPGTNDMSLAMERGETDGFCGVSYATLKTAHPDWLRSKSINFLLQTGSVKEPELANVPFIEDLTQDPETLRVVRIITAPQHFGVPFAAPPGTPPERVQALRTAFDKTMRDPAFIADVRKMGGTVDPIDGAEVAKEVRELYDAPKDLLAKAAKAMAAPQ